MASYLATFHPLVKRRAGRVAAERFSLPPFIDGSCRREPDFESEFPSVSALCRGRNFAPRLRVGDTVAYLTTKGRWGALPDSHWRLVAVLRIVDRLDSHEEGAAWYRAHRLPVPSNCWVRENPPIPYERTLQDSPLESWDRSYRVRARRWPVFLVTEPLFRELWRPPIVTAEMLEHAFGRVPATQTPPRVPDDGVVRLMEMARRSD